LMRLAYQFQGPKVKVTRLINADTSCRWRTTTRISHRRHDLKGQGRKVTWSVWAVLAQCCICVIRGQWGHTVSAEPSGHTSCYLHICVSV